VIAEKALDYLDAPIVRVGARLVPMPFNENLERATIPSQQDIAAAVRGLV
jgi:pyruvate dehydrogenase E1 component beta subunit